ncbi:glycerate kinase [Nakamurella sp. UYEF19]|uniref:glycerate kinase n=1 Tax=Nakamurella sp. UYEF19 TaxID=1756392 RepID=UPI003398CB68
MTTSPRILLAPDKFKGSISAAGVAASLRSGLLGVRPDLRVTALPIADGGDGTVSAAVAVGYRRVEVIVAGPTGAPVATSFALRGDQAVVELADACGLTRLPGGIPAPMTAGTRGLGEVLRAALRAGARSVVMGVGGSAGTDGGAGMLVALGAQILDCDGRPIDDGGRGLASARSLDLTGLDPSIAGIRIVLASDVDNPLLGPSGAAAVYGPQKGSEPHQVAALDQALARWAEVVAHTVPGDFAGTAGAGAAGGVGFAAMAVLGATPRPGIDLVLEMVDFAAHLRLADLVVTGEGSLDTQTLQGKGPAGVAAAAEAAGVPVIAVAGRVALSQRQLTRAGFTAAYALADLEPDVNESMAHPGPLLERIGAEIARNV